MREKEHTKETKSKKFNYMNASWQDSGDNLSQDHKIAFVQDAKIQKESSFFTSSLLFSILYLQNSEMTI